MADSDLLLPLSDVPYYQTVFVVRSSDGGHTWGPPVEVASESGKAFEEPCLLALDETRLLMLLRENRTHHVHQCVSKDGGHSWSEPEQTPILGYPADLIRLPDGRLLCAYGFRYEPYGIRAVLSQDEGQTWDMAHPVVLRDDFANRDLGYPAPVLLPDGRLFVVYYGQDTDGVTCIWATTAGLE
jgi:hypothetical protein